MQYCQFIHSSEEIYTCKTIYKDTQKKKKQQGKCVILSSNVRKFIVSFKLHMSINSRKSGRFG